MHACHMNFNKKEGINYSFLRMVIITRGFLFRWENGSDCILPLYYIAIYRYLGIAGEGVAIIIDILCMTKLTRHERVHKSVRI